MNYLSATNPTSSYIMMAVMLVVIYLIMFLPQRKQLFTRQWCAAARGAGEGKVHHHAL